MIPRRVIINLIFFFGLSALLASYGYFTLIHNPFSKSTTLYSYIDDTGGVRSGFTVSLRGIPVGLVSSVGLATQLQPDGSEAPEVKVTMRINSGVTVPADTQVEVERANPLGEQDVDLLPQPGSTAPPARNGDVLPPTDTPTPPDVGQVVNAADRLFAAVPTGDLEIIIHQLALALAGRAQDLRTIISESTVLSQNTVAYSDAFHELLANAPPVLDTVAAVGPQLQQALTNTEVLVDLLNQRKYDIVNLFHTGTAFAQATNTFVDQDTPNLACLAKDLGDVGGDLSEPTNLANLNSTLLLNRYFFGPINAITPTGEAKSITGPLGNPLPGSPTRDDQTWLRVRTLLPPEQPFAVSYAPPNQIPDTYPGAACLSVFGAGVPAASQVDPAPPSENGKVVPAPITSIPAEDLPPPTAQVGGTGSGNVLPTKNLSSANASTTTASRTAGRPPVVPEGGHPETSLFVGGGLLGLGALERRELGHLRRIRRRARARRRARRSRRTWR